MKKATKILLIVAACFMVTVTLGIVFRTNLVSLYYDHYLYVPSADRDQAKKDAAVARELAVNAVENKYDKECIIIRDRASVDYKYDHYNHTFWIWAKTIDDEVIELEVSIGSEPYGNTVVDDYQIKEFFDDISRSFKAEIGIPESSDISVILRRPEGSGFGSNGLEYKYESKDSLVGILEWYYAHGENFSNEAPLPMITITANSDEMKYNMQERFEKKIQDAFGKYPVWIMLWDSEASGLDNSNYESHVYEYVKDEISEDKISGEYF